jgi:multiple sugar transport system permease protein
MRSLRSDPRVLTSPYLVGLALLIAVPLGGSLLLAVSDFAGVGGLRLTGFDNFARLVGDDAFWRSLGNSLVYIAIAVPLRLGAAVGFALLLHRRGAGLGAARVAAYLPTVVPDVAYALLWLWIFNPFFGPLSLGFSSIGLSSPEWLTDPWAARAGIAVMGAFQIGEAFVVALATRRAIPQSLYEAAAVDGARPWFTLTRLTLPVMAPILALLVLRDVVFTLQTNFVPALVVTEGGPRYATTYLPLFVYENAFRYFRFGYASAVTLTMFLITAAIVLVQYRLAQRWKLL